MLGPDPAQLAFLDNLQSVVGPLQELTSRTDPGSDWVFSATYRGRPVRIGLDRGRGPFDYVRFAAPLAVPVRLFVEGHYATYTHAVRVTTGDPEFDRRYKVHGNPPEVVAAAIDAATRQWYLATYGDKPPQTDTRDGWLSLFKGFRSQGLPSPPEISHFLDVAIGLTDRLASAYVAHKAAIAATHGPAAAEQWHAAQCAALQSIQSARSRVRTVVIVAVGALFLLPLLGVLLIALLLSLR